MGSGRLATTGFVVLRFVGLASIEMSQIDPVAHEVNFGLGGELVKQCVLQLEGVLIEEMIGESGHEPLHAHLQSRRGSALPIEKDGAVLGVDDDRNASHPCGQASDHALNGCVGVDDREPLASNEQE